MLITCAPALSTAKPLQLRRTLQCGCALRPGSQTDTNEHLSRHRGRQFRHREREFVHTTATTWAKESQPSVPTISVLSVAVCDLHHNVKSVHPASSCAHALLFASRSVPLALTVVSELEPSAALPRWETGVHTYRDTTLRTVNCQALQLERASPHGRLYLPVGLAIVLPRWEKGVHTCRGTMPRTGCCQALQLERASPHGTLYLPVGLASVLPQ